MFVRERQEGFFRRNESKLKIRFFCNLRKCGLWTGNCMADGEVIIKSGNDEMMK